MSSNRTPNWRLNEDHTFYISAHDSKLIPAGAYVRPVELCYVPQHVIDDKRWASFNKDKHIFCYYKWGYVMLPRELLREA